MTANTQTPVSSVELVEKLRDFADPDGRIPLAIVDQHGNRIGVSRRTPEEMTTSEAFVDDNGTAWMAPTAGAYRAVCLARDAHATRMREALEPFVHYYAINDCDERTGNIEVPISDLRRARQALERLSQ